MLRGLRNLVVTGCPFILLLFLCFSVSLFLCFSVSLFLCFSVSLFLCFSVSLFLCFSVSLFLCFSVSLFLCFSVSPFSILVAAPILMQLGGLLYAKSQSIHQSFRAGRFKGNYPAVLLASVRKFRVQSQSEFLLWALLRRGLA